MPSLYRHEEKKIVRGAADSGPVGFLFPCLRGRIGEKKPFPPYSAIVYKDDGEVRADDWEGRKIAKGEAAADDANVIQSAVDAVANSGGGKVLIKSGVYYISHYIRPKNYVWLAGEGMRATKLVSTADLYGKPLIGAYTNTEPPTSLDNPLVGVKISDIEIDGSNSLGKGIFFQYYKFCVFENVYVHDCYATGFGNDGGYAVVYNSCIAENNGRGELSSGCHGFGIGTGAYEQEATVLVNCFASGNYRAGFTFERVFGHAESGYLKFINCYSYNNTWGFAFTASNIDPVSPVKTMIINCDAVNNKQTGIYLYMWAQELIIKNNIVVGNKLGIDCSGHRGRQVVISGNLISESTYYGIRFRGRNAVILGNIIYSNGRDGVRIEGVGGDDVPGGEINFVNNIVFNNGAEATGDGLRIDGSFTGEAVENVLVAHNRFFDDQESPSQRYGITLKPTISGIIIKNNYFYGNSAAPIYQPELASIIEGNVGYITENSGTATFSGDGTTKDFLIGAHGLAITDPSKIVVKITPVSQDAIDASPCIGYVDTGDNSKIRVKFDSAPANGSDNVKITWKAIVV